MTWIAKNVGKFQTGERLWLVDSGEPEGLGLGGTVTLGKLISRNLSCFIYETGRRGMPFPWTRLAFRGDVRMMLLTSVHLRGPLHQLCAHRHCHPPFSRQ